MIKTAPVTRRAHRIAEQLLDQAARGRPGRRQGRTLPCAPVEKRASLSELQVAELGEFCCSSKPVRLAPETNDQIQKEA